MPLQGMQGWINGWVKVNNKHVVFPQGRSHSTEERSREFQISSEAGSNVQQQHSLSRRKSDRTVAKGDDRAGDTATTATSSLKAMREDPESRAIRRFNSRKNSRRLRRTISHSDLLREMALTNEKSDAKVSRRSRHAESESNTIKSHISGSSSNRISSQSASLTVQHSNQHSENDLRSPFALNGDMSSNSLRWKAKYFDSPTEGKKTVLVSDQPQKPSYPVTTGKYLNETAFVQQYEQSKNQSRAIGSMKSGNHAPKVHSGIDDDKVHLSRQSLNDSRTGRQRSPDESGDGSDLSKKAAPLAKGNSNVSMDGAGVSTEPKNVPLQRVTHNGVPATWSRLNCADGHPTKHRIVFQPPWAGPALRNTVACPSCDELDSRLRALQADLEYLRSASLRSEYICAGCEKQSLKRKMKYSNRNRAGFNESSAMNEASQRLVEVTARHKRQIEQMTRERSRWQHDMHCKLSKFAMMCKHWNEESAIRSEEVTSLESELSSIQTERDELASEVQVLRAQLQVNAKEAADHQQLFETLKKYEDDGLQIAENDIWKRDAIIADLTARLGNALNTLEKEREQQRQRRQIIFPVTRTSHPSLSPLEVKQLTEELEKAKEETRLSQTMFEAAKVEAAQNEHAWRVRYEQLEKLVHQNASISTGSKDEGDRSHSSRNA